MSVKQGFREWFFAFPKALASLVLLSVAASFLTACTADNHDKNPDTVQVKVPWLNSDGTKYTLQNVQVHTIKDMVALKGDSARFLMSPGASGHQLTGYNPKIRTMRTNDGTYIPEDYLSSQLLSLYAHFEKLGELDTAVGASQAIGHWPRQQTVAVSVQEVDPHGQAGTDNAMYTSDYDAFLFLPYTRSDLPFTVNAGVIGHEHFHSLFYQLLIKPSGSLYPFAQQGNQTQTAHAIDQVLQLMGITAIVQDGVSALGDPTASAQADAVTQARDNYHAYLLRGLNEGLADAWGWIYSNDSHFVERSAAEYTSRALDGSSHFNLTQNQVAVMAMNSAHHSPNPGKNTGMSIDAAVYDVGTAYAQRLFQAEQEAVKNGTMTNEDGRKLLAKAILRSIAKLQSEFVALDTSTTLDPLRPLQLIQNEIPELTINLQSNQ
jgi:hypothetical protein